MNRARSPSREEDSPGPRSLNRRWVPSWVVGFAGLALGVAVVLQILIPNGMDATAFLAFGEDSPELRAYAEDLLDHVETRPMGHDGKFFFVQANDPWLRYAERTGALLDRPVYRAQRMLFPLVAGGLGLLPPAAVAWAMLGKNVAALAVGAGLTAALSQRWGRSPWLGLAFPMNVGLLYEIWIGGAGVLAFALGIAALYALNLERNRLAAVLFACAVLTKEAMFAFTAGVVALIWLNERRLRWRLVLPPLVTMALWHIYIQTRLSGAVGLGASWSIFSPPLVGMVQGIRRWGRDPEEVLMNVALLVIIVAFLSLAPRSREPIVWSALPFSCLAGFLSVQVWMEPADLSRAVAPVITAAPPFLLPRRTARISPLDRSGWVDE